jgi:hypothetical protein
VANRKTVTRQTIIGEKGIALIGRRCLEMGYLFHPRRVDHGIDGHIDLVDRDSGAVLNQTLLVQSKASDRPFASETDQSFRFVCDERDLDLWLAGNAPVILVLSHPEQDEAWWVDVKAAFPDAESRASRAVTVVKQTQRFDASAASALLRLAVPAGAGLYLRPPPIIEILTTNLLPIVDLPPVIFTAPASARTYIEAGEILDAGKRPAFLLRDGLVASFASLREPPLSALCDGDVEEFDISEWANSDEADVQYRFMDLVSRTVENSYPDLRWHNARRHMHFRATSDLSARKAGRGPGSRGRTVFGPHYAKSDPERISYYHHAALSTKYRRIAGTWYCQLEPGYCFTTDGHTEASFADSLLAGIKRLDRHPAVRGWTRVWANHLNKQPDLDSLDRPVLFGPLETVTVDRGVDDRWWGPVPTEALPEEEPEESSGEEALAMARLATEDIDTDDLLTLVADPESEPKPETATPSRRRPQRKGTTKRVGGGGRGRGNRARGRA